MITRVSVLLEVSPELTRQQRKNLRGLMVDVLNEHLDFDAIDNGVSPYIAYFIHSQEDV